MESFQVSAGGARGVAEQGRGALSPTTDYDLSENSSPGLPKRSVLSLGEWQDGVWPLAWQRSLTPSLFGETQAAVRSRSSQQLNGYKGILTAEAEHMIHSL